MSRLSAWAGRALAGLAGSGGRVPADDADANADADTDSGSAGPDDWALWRRARAGHAPSATRLVALLTPQAYGLALRLLGRPEDAEDAVQDAFLRLWRAEPADRGGARLSTYFNTIVINRCRSAGAARRETATDPDALTALHDVRAGEGAAAPAPALVERVAGFSDPASQRRLQLAIAGLPARQRMAISMWAYADAEAHEIAHALEVNVNAAHQLLHRAREALRAAFDTDSP